MAAKCALSGSGVDMRCSVCRRALTLLLACMMHAASEETVSAVSFEIAGVSPRLDELRRVAEELIAIPLHQPLDSATLRESVEALHACHLFESIEVKLTEGHVKFLLTPACYVRDIRIRGGFPLFDDEVEKAMNTHAGAVFSPRMLTQQDSLLEALYKSEGFVSPRVEVTSREYRPKGLDRVVNVRVGAGAYYRVKTLEVAGNRAYSNFQLKRRLKSWRTSLVPTSAGRFARAVLREDVKALTGFYRAAGFADAEIRDTVSTDSSTHSVRVGLAIHEGDRYKVRFSRRRDRGFRRGILRSDLVIYKTGNRNNLGVRKSVHAIEKRMRKAGFLQAQVTSSDTTILRRRFTERRVHIAIRRGARTTVSSITIKGGVSLNEKTVRAQMLHVDKGFPAKRAYNPDRLHEDVSAVQALYRTQGFLRATAASEVALTETSVAIAIVVREGPRTLIGNVWADTERFAGIDAQKAITVEKGDVYRFDLLKRDAGVLQAMIAEHGYPHVSVTPVVTMRSDSSSADVELRVEEGPLVYMGETRFTGAFRTRDGVLRREVKAMRGKPLSLRSIVETQKGLRDLGLFSSVRFRTIGLRENRDTVHVFVEVAEKRSKYATVGGGYESDKGLFAHAKVGNRNVLGLNKEAWVDGEIGQVRNRGEIGVLDPRFLGVGLRALVEAFAERTSELNQNWGTAAYGISSGLTAPLGTHMVVGLGVGYQRRRLLFDNEAAAAAPVEVSSEQRPRNIVTMTPSLAWDLRDSFTRPRKGVFVGSSVTLSRNIGSTLDNFVKLQLEARLYVTPFHPLTFAGVVRGGYIHPTGQGSVSSDQRFYLGGTGTVRGFAENLFHPADTSGGNASMSASLEARIDVGLNIELAVFTDIGRLENDFAVLASNQFRSAAGGGVRYITPIGPIGILYGLKLDREPGEDIGAFHFSLGYTF